MQTLSETIAGLTEDDRKVLGYLGFIGFLPTLFWGGFVTMILWSWFMVPLGLVEIGMAHALGLSCVVTWVRARNPVKQEMDQDKYRIPLFFIEVATWCLGCVVLGFGQIFALFM